jgi:hypothetical protein
MSPNSTTTKIVTLPPPQKKQFPGLTAPFKSVAPLVVVQPPQLFLDNYRTGESYGEVDVTSVFKRQV